MSQIIIFKFLFTNITDFFIFYDSYSSFLNNFTFLFLKLIIFIASSIKDSQNFFIQSFPLHISCLFSMLLNDDIVAIKKPDGICSHISVVDEFSGFYLHLSIYFIKHSRST